MGLAKATQPGRAALAELPGVDWDCAVVADGSRHTCVGCMETKDEIFQPVRFVESGRFFHRVVIEGLRFADAGGKTFPCDSRLEISAWPDRLAFRLELDTKVLPAAGTVELHLGDRRASATLAAKTSVRLEAFGLERCPVPKRGSRPCASRSLSTKRWAATGCQLPEEPWSNAKGTYYPEEHLDRLDRWRVALRNDSDRPTVARLMFKQKHHPAHHRLHAHAVRRGRQAHRLAGADFEELAPAAGKRRVVARRPLVPWLRLCAFRRSRSRSLSSRWSMRVTAESSQRRTRSFA